MTHAHVIPRPRAEESAFAFCCKLHYWKSRFLAEFIPSEVEGLGMTIGKEVVNG
jgi:hypothetical protein